MLIDYIEKGTSSRKLIPLPVRPLGVAPARQDEEEERGHLFAVPRDGARRAGVYERACARH